MIKIFRCSYCNFESQNEQEVVEHEKTHSETIECTKVQGKDEVPCTMNILEKCGDYELTFIWRPVASIPLEGVDPRKMTSTYLVNEEKMREMFYEKATDN